jgi:hypothetical protein
MGFVAKQSSGAGDRRDRGVANTRVRHIAAGGQKGSSGTVVGYACPWTLRA